MMNEFFINSAFAGVTISLVSYMLGMYLKKKFKLGIFNPLLIAIAVTMVILFALNVDYDTYNTGAKYLSWLLTPSTVCLAIPLYEQISLLKKNFAAVAAGIVIGHCNDVQPFQGGHAGNIGGGHVVVAAGGQAGVEMQIIAQLMHGSVRAPTGRFQTPAARIGAP